MKKVLWIVILLLLLGISLELKGKWGGAQAK